MYVDPRPSEAWIALRLDEVAPPPGQPDGTPHESWKIDVMRRWAPRARTVLDAGTGSGAFVRAAADAGYDAAGQDLSDAAAASAAATYGVRVVGGPLSSVDRAWDAITMWDVLEHAVHPVQLLRDASDRLSDHGVVIITTPHANGLSARVRGERWWVRGPTDHLVLFSRRGLRTALADAGLVEIALETIHLAPPYPPEATADHPRANRAYAALSKARVVREAMRMASLGDWLLAVARRSRPTA